VQGLQEFALGGSVWIYLPQEELIARLIISGVSGIPYFSPKFSDELYGFPDLQAVYRSVIALVVVGQEVVVARLEVIAGIFEAADSPCGLGQARKRVGVSHELGQDAEASLGILIEEYVRRVGVSNEDGPKL
jgi:hypothetical protein